MRRKDYSLLGQYCRADVRYFGSGAVLTGHLAGESVAKVFSESDDPQLVFDVAYALAFEGRFQRPVSPRSGITLLDLPAVQLPEMAGG